MSEASKAARAAMKKKIGRITSGDPRQKVDASSWTPPEMMNTEAKTGLRPVSRRAFKKGGKVVACMGENAKQNAGKKPRKAGGGEATKIANAKINRNVKEANAEEFGKPHTGGYRKGGRTHKDMGGPMVDPRLNMVKPSLTALGAGAVPGRKDGGKADASQDKKLIKKAFRQHETAEHSGKHVPLHLRKGGKIHKDDGDQRDRLLCGQLYALGFQSFPNGQDHHPTQRPYPYTNDKRGDQRDHRPYDPSCPEEASEAHQGACPSGHPEEASCPEARPEEAQEASWADPEEASSGAWAASSHRAWARC